MKGVLIPRRHTRLVTILLLAFSLLVLPSSVTAAELGWTQLSERERGILKPFQKQWDKYSLSTRKTMRAWASLSSAARAKIKKRHVQWRVLSAASKAKVIRKLDRYKRMPSWKRKKLQAWRKWVKRLPKAEQEKLHKSLPKMGAKQRKAYIRQLENKYGKP